MLYGCVYLVLKDFHDLFLANLVVLVAAVGGDGETWRNGNPNKVHLSKVGTLATKFLSHFCITFGLSVTKGIYSFVAHKLVFVICYNKE